MRSYTTAILVTGLIVGSTVIAQDSNEPKAKHTIKEVMKVAHRDKLLNKVVDGNASKEEKDQLLDLYLSLAESKPPQGEDGSWNAKSGRLIWAAAAVAVGRPNAEAQLKEVTNCKACHSVHKPE